MSDSSSSDEELVVRWFIDAQSNKKRKRRRYKTHPILLQRNVKGAYVILITDLKEHPDKFFNYFRMNQNQFDTILGHIQPIIEKKETTMGKPIASEIRLAVTLRFLATGDSYHSLGYAYFISPSTLHQIIPEVCMAIWQAMHEIYMKMPKSQGDWKEISNKFEELWQFPNCIGAVDGKHIAIQAPPNSGSLYFNYKGFHSVVLLALADARYRFIYIDVGSFGRNSDGGIFSHSSLGVNLANGTLNLPQDNSLPKGEQYGPMPYVIVADEAFPLTKHIMRPFPGWRNGLPNDRAIYNYRLSRARRVVENSFGILSSRFRVFLTTINLSVNNVISVVKAATLLHNYLQTSSTAPVEVMPETVSSTPSMTPLRKCGNKGSSQAEHIRDNFMQYFLGPGEVAWQQEMVQKGSN